MIKILIKTPLNIIFAYQMGTNVKQKMISASKTVMQEALL